MLKEDSIGCVSRLISICIDIYNIYKFNFNKEISDYDDLSICDSIVNSNKVLNKQSIIDKFNSMYFNNRKKIVADILGKYSLLNNDNIIIKTKAKTKGGIVKFNFNISIFYKLALQLADKCKDEEDNQDNIFLPIIYCIINSSILISRDY